jgi:hypothetical protein
MIFLVVVSFHFPNTQQAMRRKDCLLFSCLLNNKREEVEEV